MTPDRRHSPLRLLREGPVTRIFEAEGDGGAPVVVKAMRTDARIDALARARFRREIALAASLRHPGLPATPAQGDDWIAFERLDPSLADDGVRRRFAAAGAVRPLLHSLADTLAYLHARGVVHRDIKPAHVMFRDGRPVLIDLGAAGLAGEDPLEGSEIVGSPAWMAPEQLSGARPAPPADIWSLCAVMTWLLTGKRPFTGSADAVLAARRQGADPAFPDHEGRHPDETLVRMLKAGLDGEAEKRPRAVDFTTALRA